MSAPPRPTPRPTSRPTPRPAPRWAAGAAVPDWLALREGTRPLVIVAPHGGRRRRAIRRGDNVNDLHTAAIALELAERTGAHALVNHGLDRNDIDLNRISHLVGRAPGVLGLLRAAVDAAAAGGEVPLVLFVHGWNMVVPCCDIGIGLRRRDGVLSGRHPTLSRARYDGTIAAIERELAARGVVSAIGRRYTASGHDNAAQLFSGRHAAHEDAVVAALGRLSAEGRVDAVQLELGIPLRWEGPARTALIDGLAAALVSDCAPRAVDATEPAAHAHALASDCAPRAADVTQPAAHAEAVVAPAPSRPSGGWSLPPTREHGATASQGFALQAVLDADGRVAMFGGAEATGARSLASRFCVLATDGTMMLLVGEGEWDGDEGRFAMDGLHWRVHDDGRRVELQLRGPMIRYRTHDAYLDLEDGLSASDLVQGEGTLLFEEDLPGHGRLTGRVRCGDLELDVDATAFLDRGGRRGGEAGDHIRVMAARPGAGAWIARSDAGVALELHRDAAPLGVIRSAAPVEAGFREAEIVARVPVWRPVADGVFARWTFGVVRCRFEGDEGEVAGLFDTLEVFGLPRPPST